MLAVLVAAAAIVPLTNPAAERGSVSADQYQEPKFCGACHKALYGQWKGGMHSHATDDPFYAGSFLMASAETGGAVDEFCSRCHTPAGFLGAEVPPADHSGLGEIGREGVFCDFCHTVTGHDAPVNAQYVVNPGEAKRGPFGDGESPAHKVAYSEFHTSPEFCATCHDVDHPANGLPLETTYREWAGGPYNTGDPGTRTTCQDCHMTPGPGVMKPNPGKASEIGDERPHIWTHNVVGGGGVAALLGEEAVMALATERLKAAAELELGLPAQAGAGRDMDIQVRVTNVGCGHSIPTGVTELREVWLEVVVQDAAGRTVYTSGQLDDAGEISEGAVKYGVVVADAAGNPTPKFWLAESKVSDHRIPPQQTVNELFSVPVPADSTGPLTVRVRLRYRAASPKLLRETMGPDAEVNVPIIDMAEAEGPLPLAQ